MMDGYATAGTNTSAVVAKRRESVESSFSAAFSEASGILCRKRNLCHLLFVFVIDLSRIDQDE